MTNFHYIIDEELSGKQTKVEREYVEVDREAKVGDYFIALEELDGITNGEIYQVESLTEDKIHSHKGRMFFDDEGRWRAIWSPHKYRTLEPTEYVRIDGKRYKLADRRALVGEQIITVSYQNLGNENVKKGDILEVTASTNTGTYIDSRALFDEVGDFVDKYYVLEPAEESEEEEEPPKTTDDLIANLASEVARLTRKVAELEEQTDSNRKDIVKQAEEFAEFIHTPTPYAEQSDLIELNGRISTLEADGVAHVAKEVAEHLLTEVLMRERGTK
ncbi:hypothetical protein [Virgibacillus pantothenticus]|uniref:hypothetical protein n=1 Tax=Virgibacillus pantothenticus TaxID=1473 RepID=UPI000987A07A|nr:hypothetical protein [Virgibacillus pantothenticus]